MPKPKRNTQAYVVDKINDVKDIKAAKSSPSGKGPADDSERDNGDGEQQEGEGEAPEEQDAADAPPAQFSIANMQSKEGEGEQKEGDGKGDGGDDEFEREEQLVAADTSKLLVVLTCDMTTKAGYDMWKATLETSSIRNDLKHAVKSKTYAIVIPNITGAKIYGLDNQF